MYCNVKHISLGWWNSTVGRITALHIWMTQFNFQDPMWASEPTRVIPDHRASDKPWAPLTVVQKQTNAKEKISNQTMAHMSPQYFVCFHPLMKESTQATSKSASKQSEQNYNPLLSLILPSFSSVTHHFFFKLVPSPGKLVKGQITQIKSFWFYWSGRRPRSLTLPEYHW